MKNIKGRKKMGTKRKRKEKYKEDMTNSCIRMCIHRHRDSYPSMGV